MNLLNRRKVNAIPIFSRHSLLLILLLCSAFILHAQNQKVQITGNNLTIRAAFSQIEQQTKFSIDYNANLLDGAKTVAGPIAENTLSAVMTQLLEGTGCSFTIKNNHVIITRQTSSMQIISGTVTDEKGDPVIGANVSVKGTTQGTITDIDGKYSLEAPTQGTLVFSYVGYTNKEESINGRSIIPVALNENALNLNEVVVIGYGETRKKDLSVAVSTLPVSQELKSRPTNGFASALQGKMPGVMVTGNGGDPLKGADIVIRGKGSREREDPLYVVDGVPGAPFNWEDVESVSVLKDAASAAIYGATAGTGGVIVITTKKAAAGNVKVDANVYYGVQSVWRKPQALTAEQYVKVRTDDANARGVALPAGVDPTKYPYGQTTRTNWIDEIFRTGSMQHYAISLSGGSDKIKTFASVAYDKKEGTILNTWSENLAARMNIDFKILEWLTFGQRVNYNHSNGQGDINTGSHTGVTAAAMQYPASATVYEFDQQGNPVLDPNTGKQLFGGTVPRWAGGLGINTFGEVQNPVATLKRLKQYRPDQTLFSTSTLTLNPLEGLTIRSDFSAYSNNRREEFFNYRITEIGKPNDQNSRKIGSWQSRGWLWETTVNYNKEINEKHIIQAMGGYTMGYRNERNASAELYSFEYEDNWAQHWVNAKDFSKSKPEEGFWEDSRISMFARGSYSFDDRYFVTGSIRRDASSRLYSKNNAGIFPAVSGSWKISSEKFFPKNNLVSLLKLRASWGQIGNIGSVGPYSYSVNLQMNDNNNFGQSQHVNMQGFGLATISNLNLKWERSEQIDIGLDVNLLRDRLTLGMDYFIKNTFDLIDEMSIPSVGGIKTAPKANVGSVRNSGFEFAAGWTEKRGDWTYTINGNFATLKNEITELGNNRTYINHTDELRQIQPLRSQLGAAWYSYYLVPVLGIFQSDAEANAYRNKDNQMIQPEAKAGDLKFKDVNGDGKITSNDDREIRGSYTPEFTYALTGNVAWKSFDLSIMLQGIAGVKVYNGFKTITYPGDQGWNMDAAIMKSWNYDHTSNIPRVDGSDANGNYKMWSDFYLEDGSYLRLKNLTVGYTLPKSLMKKLNLRFYASVENLLTLTKYKGMDPEVGDRGLDGGRYPQSRIISLGFNFNF